VFTQCLIDLREYIVAVITYAYMLTVIEKMSIADAITWTDGRTKFNYS